MEDLTIKSIRKIKMLKKVLLFISQFVNHFDIYTFKYSNGLEISKIIENKIFQTIKHL